MSENTEELVEEVKEETQTDEISAEDKIRIMRNYSV